MATNRRPMDVRRGARRDRRGRGQRGPVALPGPLTPSGVPGAPTSARRFDALVLRAVNRTRERFPERVDAIEFAVEDHPLLPDDWAQPVPYASGTPVGPGVRARVVVFRRPILTHADGAADLETLVLDAIVAELAELWDADPGAVDPRN